MSTRRKRHRLPPEVAKRQRELWEIDPVVLTQKQFRELRPSRNIVTTTLWWLLAFGSLLSIHTTPSSDTIQSTLEHEVLIVVDVVFIVAAILRSAAGWIKQNSKSLACEIAAMMLTTAVLLVYGFALIELHPNTFYSNPSFMWCAGMSLGCLLRVTQIFRRGY